MDCTASVRNALLEIHKENGQSAAVCFENAASFVSGNAGAISLTIFSRARLVASNLSAISTGDFNDFADAEVWAVWGGLVAPTQAA